MEDGIHIQVVKYLPSLGGVEHVARLVDAKFLEDHGEFLFKHFADAMLDRILEDEVDGAHHMRLANTIHAADALL